MSILFSTLFSSGGGDAELINEQYFTSSGTFNIPTGKQWLYITAVAGGAGGGRNDNGGIGGGAGGGCVSYRIFVKDLTTLNITIGAGGAGTITGPGDTLGSDGGDTEITGLLFLGGGSNDNTGGIGISPYSVGTISDANAANGGGGSGEVNPLSRCYLGFSSGSNTTSGGSGKAGGGSIFAVGGNGGAGGTTNSGTDGTLGSGGGGGGGVQGGGAVGGGGSGDGGDGLLIVRWS